MTKSFDNYRKASLKKVKFTKKTIVWLRKNSFVKKI